MGSTSEEEIDYPSPWPRTCICFLNVLRELFGVFVDSGPCDTCLSLLMWRLWVGGRVTWLRVAVSSGLHVSCDVLGHCKCPCSLWVAKVNPSHSPRVLVTEELCVLHLHGVIAIVLTSPTIVECLRLPMCYGLNRVSVPTFDVLGRNRVWS